MLENSKIFSFLSMYKYPFSRGIPRTHDRVPKPVGLRAKPRARLYVSRRLVSFLPMCNKDFDGAGSVNSFSQKAPQELGTI